MLKFKCDHCGVEHDAQSASPPEGWQVFMVMAMPQPGATAAGPPAAQRSAQIHACEKPECVKALAGSLFKDQS